jgi:hypothetical protein
MKQHVLGEFSVNYIYHCISQQPYNVFDLIHVPHSPLAKSVDEKCKHRLSCNCHDHCL